MARSYRPVVRDQEFLLPPNMADWLPQEHLVWFVIDVVEQLDTTAFHARRRRGGAGRAGFDPDMLLALLLYAYAVGERSSRRIEQLCIDHVAFRVLCGQDGPDHTTIARFRAEHAEAFADLFAQMLRLCAAAGMVKVGVVSIDGTKVAANAARGANRSATWLREEAERIAAQIVAEAATTDAAEDHLTRSDSSDDDTLPPSMSSREDRAGRLRQALAELDRQEKLEAQRDAVDHAHGQDRITDLREGRLRPGPMPAGVDPIEWHEARILGLRTQLEAWIGIRGTRAQNKRRDLRKRLKRTEASLARARDHAAEQGHDLRGLAARRRDRRRARLGGAMVNLTDPDSRLMTHGAGGGSVQGYNAQLAVSDDHLVLGVHLSQDANDSHCFTPTLAAAMTTLTDLDLIVGTVLADAGYFTAENLTAAGPDRLIAPGKTAFVAREAKLDPASGPPPDDLDVRDQMRHRLREPDNAEIYKRRSATVETVIAHLKDQTRLRRFARRGLQAATSELQLAATALNLTKLHGAALRPC